MKTVMNTAGGSTQKAMDAAFCLLSTRNLSTVNMVADAIPVMMGLKNQDRMMGTTPLYGGNCEGSGVAHCTAELPAKTKAKPMMPPTADVIQQGPILPHNTPQRTTVSSDDNNVSLPLIASACMYLGNYIPSFSYLHDQLELHAPPQQH